MKQFTKKMRFNQLKEGDLFTFRKNGLITNDYNNDQLLRYSKVINGDKCNALCYGGAWFRINNKHSIVWACE